MAPVRLDAEIESEEREGMAEQREGGRGMARGTEEMVRDETEPVESQVMLVQLQGVASEGFQSGKEEGEDPEVIQVKSAATSELGAENDGVGMRRRKKKGKRRRGRWWRADLGIENPAVSISVSQVGGFLFLHWVCLPP